MKDVMHHVYLLLNSVLLGGVIPFAIVFVDLDELLKSIWQGELYLSLGYASMASMLLGVATASVTVVLVFFQLCNEVSMFCLLHSRKGSLYSS